MSAASPGFLRRLFLRPALWAAMFFGIAAVLIDNGCGGYQGVAWKAICALSMFDHRSPHWQTWGDVTIIMVGVLYAALRVLEIRKIWDTTHRVAWVAEIGLLVIGEYLVFFTVAFVAFATAKGI